MQTAGIHERREIGIVEYLRDGRFRIHLIAEYESFFCGIFHVYWHFVEQQPRVLYMAMEIIRQMIFTVLSYGRVNIFL